MIIDEKSERTQRKLPVMHLVVEQELAKFPEVIKSKNGTFVFTVFLEVLALSFCIVTKPDLRDIKKYVRHQT